MANVPNNPLVALPGSERTALPGAERLGKADPSEEICLTVYVRRNPTAPPPPTVEEMALLPPGQRAYLTDDQLARMHGADPRDLEQVAQYARQFGFKTEEPNIAARSIQIRGTIAQAEKAFGVELHQYAHAERGRYRGRTGAIHVPRALRGIVRAIFGFDNRRIGRSFRRSSIEPVALRAAAHPRPFLPTDLARIYNFPAQADGSGQCIAILAFNGAIMDTGASGPGGYKLTGVQKYFRDTLGMQPPDIKDIVVHGPGNDPGDETNNLDSTGEILLDLEVSGGTAPGAKIRVYFTEFTEQGWVDAIHAVVTDAQNQPSVLSISYGNAETLSNAGNYQNRGSLWTMAAIEQVNVAFQAAALKGITILAASGDDGSSDGVDSRAHADFPASSPFVLACGGTRLLATAAGGYRSEAVWNDGPGSATGGGVSDLFPLPSWQQNAGVPPSVNSGHRIGRGVPDVCGDGDPNSGVIVSDVDGNVDPTQPTGGTSAVAPLWAGLVARLNQAAGARMGFLNPLLYTQLATGVLHDVTKGNNGAYRARSGWDPCTGLGSPNGARLLQGITGAHAPGHTAAPALPAAPAGIPAAPDELASLRQRVDNLEALVRRLAGVELDVAVTAAEPEGVGV